MTTIKFAALLVAIVIGCASLGSAASYYINFRLVRRRRTDRLPLPLPGQRRCMFAKPEPTRSRSSRVALRLALHRSYPYSLPAAEKLRSRFPLP